MDSIEASQLSYPLQTNISCSPNCNRLDHGFVRKRTRATAEQLSVLEDIFSVNVSPNSKLRKKLSEQLNMSERSIQIWFQNRRAKVKHIQKKAELQMQQAAIRAQLYHYQMSSLMQPPTMFNPYIQRIPMPRAQSVDVLPYKTLSLTEPFIPVNSFYDSSWNDTKLSRQSMPPVPQTECTKILEEFPETSHFSSSPSTFGEETSNCFSVSPVNELLLDSKTITINNRDSDTWYYNTKSAAESTVFSNSELLEVSFFPKGGSIDPFIDDPEDGDLIEATTLTIGAWYRVKLNARDLVCKFSQFQNAFIWHIEESLSQFKIIIPLNLVTQIKCFGESGGTASESSTVFFLNQPPLFYMQSDNKWIQCRDFTENQQASLCLQHTIKGPTGQLKQVLTELANKLDEIKLLMHIDQPLLSSQNWSSTVVNPLYI